MQKVLRVFDSIAVWSCLECKYVCDGRKDVPRGSKQGNKVEVARIQN